ncbi:MAG: DUF2232 domain-containing protein [Pseudomonadota bacterium]
MAGTGFPKELLRVFLVTALLFLPAMSEELGWMRTFIPLPVFYFLVVYGEKDGVALLTKAIVAAGVGCIVVNTLPGYIISLSFLPLAFVLARSFRQKDSVLRSGMTGSIVLVTIWFIGAGLYGIIEHVHPYRQILDTIDISLTETFTAYQQSSEISAETLAQIEAAFTRIRTLIPVIFPAIILITTLSTVWVNMLLGDMLIKKKNIQLSHWPPYGQWKLPDQMVWAVIIFGIGLMLPIPALNKICLNGVLISGILYFFQGLAVLSNLFNRWAVPWAFRLFVYALILVQAYGIIFLAIAGLIDVWFDLRKSRNETT